MKLLLFSCFLLSHSAFADVVGTWIYSGSGCRSESLNPESHRSKAPNSENPVSEATFTFKSNGTASMNAIFEDGKQSREVGSYTLRGNELIIPEWRGVEIRTIGNRIVIKDPEAGSVCRSNEVFVYVLSSLD